MSNLYRCPKCQDILSGKIGDLVCEACGYKSRKDKEATINLPVIKYKELGLTAAYQLRKIAEEYGEVAEAVAQENPVQVIRESLDSMQTFWTLINIIANDYGINIDKLYKEHCEKLERKGYL